MSSMFEFSAMGIPFINYFLISAFLHPWSGRWGKRRLLQEDESRPARIDMARDFAGKPS